MASVYRVFADYLDYEPIELRSEGGGYVLYGRIAFLPGAGRSRNCLYLNREWVVEGRQERYAGPVAVVVDGADAEGGIAVAELGRRSLRLTLDADAAARIGDGEVTVEFDTGDADYARLRGELVAMFEGLGLLRLEDGETAATGETDSDGPSRP